MLHSRAHHGGLGSDEGHRLALHVRAHEGPVGVVVLQEGDERRGGGDDLLGGDVEVGHFFPGHRNDVALVPGEALLLGDSAVGVHGSVGHAHVHPVLLVGGQEDDLPGHPAVFHLAPGGDEESVLVEAGIGGKGGHEADIGTFRRLDGADPAVVGIVDVPGLEPGPFPGKPSGAKGGKPAPVGHLGERVRLVHELGELPRAEELPEGGSDGAHVDQVPGHGVAQVGDGGHPLLGDTLHAKQADADLVLEKFSHGTDTPVAEVVDVVVRLLRIFEFDDALDDAHQVFLGEEPHVLGNFEAELAVHLVAPHSAEVVPAGVEEETVDIFPCVLDPGRLVGTELPEELHHGLVGVEGTVLFKSGGHGGVRVPHQDLRPAHAPELFEVLLGYGPVPGQHGSAVLVEDGLGGQHALHVLLGDILLHRLRIEEVEDAFVCGRAEDFQQEGRGNLLPVVDIDGDKIPGGQAEFEPCSPVGDDFRGIGFLAGNLFILGEIDACGAGELVYHHALRSVDDEGASSRHQGEVAEENLLFLHFFRLPVHQTNGGPDGPRPGEVPLAGFLFLSGGLVEKVPDELEGEGAVIAFNGKHFVEQFLQPLRNPRLRSGVFLAEPVV